VQRMVGRQTNMDKDYEVNGDTIRDPHGDVMCCTDEFAEEMRILRKTLANLFWRTSLLRAEIAHRYGTSLTLMVEFGKHATAMRDAESILNDKPFPAPSPEYQAYEIKPSPLRPLRRHRHAPHV
jgi:hypothetical protein